MPLKVAAFYQFAALPDFRELREPLRAYTGLGKPAQGAEKGADRGTRWIPTQQVAVRQLYVPGLYVQNQATPLYESVFAQPVEVSALV